LSLRRVVVKHWCFLLFLLFLTACASPGPAGPVLAISGPIVDSTTDKPVVADVYVDGELRLSKTDHIELVIPLQRDRQTEIRVKASGYDDWAITVQGAASKQLQGPVRMQPASMKQGGSAILAMAEP
jgi:hypothetical protein